MDVIKSRLVNQGLVGPEMKSVQDAVKHFGAVQAQIYSAAKWGISLRVPNLTSDSFDALFNSGAILRTHVLRPTWHFVLPVDIHWMLKLTAPRIMQKMKSSNSQLNLDRKVFDQSNSVIAAALTNGNYLTRKELAEVLAENGMKASGQRLAHIVMHAELEGVICSGPLRAKQFTYALLSERVPNTKEITREEALELLAKRYFTSHGPALVQDFAWWSGLTMKDSEQGLHLAASKLQSKIANNKKYWFSSLAGKKKSNKPGFHLLSVYDEYIISYKDYDPVFGAEQQGLTKFFGNALLSYIVVKDGRAIGTWQRTMKAKSMDATFKLQESPDLKEQMLLTREAELYATFMNTKLCNVSFDLIKPKCT